jgi:transcriptional regulator GlxA family with amidase domain
MEVTAGSRQATAKRAGSRRLSVGFILARRFTLCAFANFVDVLRLSADEGDRSRPILCGWRVLSATMEPIVSSSGIAVQPEERLGDPSRFDYVVVVGGLIDEIENLHPDYVRFLHKAAAIGVPLIGVCTGAFILHRAGLMDGYRCCVSWFHHADFLEQFDGLKPVSDQIFVVDRNRLTCSGGASSAHLAAHLVEKHVGRAQARKSLHIMIIDDALRAEKPQPGIPLDLTTDDALVKKALLLMQQHIDAPLSAAEIARRMGASRRQLERRFQSSIGMAPTLAYKIMRLEYAEFLLRHTEQSVTEIATSTGFCDSSHFIRSFRERLGMTPAAFREAA